MSEVIGDAACIAANVAAFAVFQCAFFYLPSSKTYDIVKDKLHIASEVLRDNRLGKTAICNAMLPDRPEELHAAIAEEAEQQRCARENRLVLAKWCGRTRARPASGRGRAVLVALRRKVWRPGQPHRRAARAGASTGWRLRSVMDVPGARDWQLG